MAEIRIAQRRPSLRLHQNEENVSWSRETASATYNVYAGTLATLPGGFGSCAASRVEAPTWTDASVPAAGTGRGEWLSDMGALARVFGGKVSVEGDRVILTLEPKTTATAVEWLRARVMVNHPPPDGIVFMVKIEGGS